MSTIRQYPDTATVDEFLALAREEGIIRCGQAGDAMLFDWIVFDGDTLLYAHCMLHETDKNLETAQFSTFEVTRAQRVIVESSLKTWRVFPVFCRLDPMVMIVRDPGIGRHHEVRADDPAFFLGVSQGLNFVLGQANEKKFTTPNFNELVMRASDYMIQDVVTHPKAPR